MPRNLIKSDIAIRSVKPGDPRGRINDGDGLYILLFVKGGSHGWRFDYTHEGRRKTLSLGTYPTISLAVARQKAEEARVNAEARAKTVRNHITSIFCKLQVENRPQAIVRARESGFGAAAGG